VGRARLGNALDEAHASGVPGEAHWASETTMPLGLDVIDLPYEYSTA
jgi:hypothetical protein